MMKYTVFLITSVLLFSSSPWANAETVFSQPAVVGMATMSDFDPSVAWGNHYQFAADDFILSEAAEITEVRWWGLYQKEKPAQNVQPPYPYPLPASNFTIRFFDDNDGIPGSVILEVNSIGNCNPTPLVYTGVDSETHYFEYSYRLEDPASIEGGRTYWLSIADSTASFPDDIFFSWLKSDSSNWSYCLEPGGLTGWTPYDGSPGMAFDLITGSVPCPSADLTDDCFVDFRDIAIIASQWLSGDN